MNDYGAMGPGTGIGHIEMIATTLSWEATAPILCDPAPADTSSSLELPLLIAVFRKFSRHDDLGLAPCHSGTHRIR